MKKLLYRTKKKILSGIQQLYLAFFGKSRRYHRKVFQHIYENDLFHASGDKTRQRSKSGPGSDLIQTEGIINKRPVLFEKYKVKSVLDIPCGDFHWMSKVDLTGIKYTGADIVDQLISGNLKYTSKGIQFLSLDVLNDPLPKADLILCRDLFVHLTYEQIFLAVGNIKKSGSTYLLTTSFRERDENRNLKRMGNWRPVNLEIEPFLFKNPEDVIFENCTEQNMSYNDKHLLLYSVSKL